MKVKGMSHSAAGYSQLPLNPVSPGNFADWKAHNDVFETVAAFGLIELTSLEGESAERITAGLVTDGFFDVLGAEAHLGRTFTPEEDIPGSNAVVLLSYGFWQRSFGGDPAVIGQDLRLAGGSSLIVGVMPPDFDLLENDVEVWAPRGLGPRDFANRRSHFLRVIARLREGIGVEEASSSMRGLAAGIRESHPNWMTGWSVDVVPLEEELVGGVRHALFLLLAAAVMLLLIACVNVANLSLVRNAARGRELAIRAALGAGRGTLLRASLSESFLLALSGGALGLGLAVAGRRALVALAPENLPRAAEVSIDGRVLAFGVAVSFATALVFGVGPALRAAHFELFEALKRNIGGASGRGRFDGRFGGSLVAAEVALSFCLVLGAWLLSSTMLSLVNQPAGFDRDNVLTWKASLPSNRYPGIDKQNDFYRRVLSELGRQPGVLATGMTRFLPLDGEQSTWDFLVEGRPAEDAGEQQRHPPGAAIFLTSQQLLSVAPSPAWAPIGRSR